MADRRSVRRKLSLAVSVLTVTGCLLLVTPAASWAGLRSAAAGSGFCAKVTADIGPHHAHIGDGISAEGSWFNCGDRSEYIHFRFVFRGPCMDTERNRGHFRLGPHTGIGFQIGGFIACKGVYHLTVEAYHGGLLLDRATRTMRVKP
jgi:hypothetical protein